MAKEITWRGRSEEEAKKLDFKTFLELIPSRQRRTLERGYTEEQKRLMHRINRGDNNFKTHCRDLVITPVLIGKSLSIYNGKEYAPVLITVEMLGHCLGEFAMTRRQVKHSAAGIGATRSSKAISAR